MRRITSCLMMLFALSCSDDNNGNNHDNAAENVENGRDRDVGDLGSMTDMSSPANDMALPDMALRPDMARVDAGDLLRIPLQSTVDNVQPMTGIVLWEDSWNGETVKDEAVQLEYAYVAPDSIVTAQDTYDWATFDAFLDRIAGRQHQALVRFYYTYPGRQTVVPQYIKDRGDYQETLGQSEGQQTSFPDWTNAELQRAHLAFYTAFAARYDDDPRIAFLQVGFGLWGEYHIYDGPNAIGQQFPDKAFQTQFLNHLSTELDTLHWSLSIDAGDDYYSPIADDAALLALKFGNFDDSFMHEEHAGYNESMWNLFGHTTRYETSPHGGELSYYSDFDQENALNVAGLYGRTYEELSAKFHITYMIGNDQPDHQSIARIKEAGMANGYKFAVTSFEASESHSVVTIVNAGIAPIYYDAFVAVNEVRGTDSLRGLLPGDSMTAVIESGGAQPTLTIECDRLVPGQVIEYDASL